MCSCFTLSWRSDLLQLSWNFPPASIPIDRSGIDMIIGVHSVNIACPPSICLSFPTTCTHWPLQGFLHLYNYVVIAVHSPDVTVSTRLVADTCLRRPRMLVHEPLPSDGRFHIWLSELTPHTSSLPPSICFNSYPLSVAWAGAPPYLLVTADSLVMLMNIGLLVKGDLLW